ncbi:nodulation protein NfeD [Anaerolineales bacterium HSG24]|nr:nodulation protein NfeD [Anaerolineales bacterium HSG24]
MRRLIINQGKSMSKTHLKSLFSFILGQFYKSLLTIISLIMLSYFLTGVGQAQTDGELLVIDVEGPVTPVMLGFIERSLEEADVRDAEALIIRLDTPGGQVELTKDIIRAIIASDVPVVVYVSPPGAHAASAGTFITLAAHVAAMAPNTSIGAASPVGGSGEDIEETMKSKVENILTADIRGLADRRGEAAIKWAEETVTESKAASAEEALELGVIDMVATDLDDLIDQLDGFTVEVNRQEVTLKTSVATISYIKRTLIEDILSVIVNPSIALLLISMGSLALTYEFINPGGYIGGVIGLICLLIGFYAIGQLPVNYAGLALIILAFILFAAELFTPVYGALTATGVVAFIIGGLILFNTDEFTYRMPLPSIIGIPLVMAMIMTFGLAKIVQSGSHIPVIGQRAMIGATGTVKVTLIPQGTVFVCGERWNAVSVEGEFIEVGATVEVVKSKGLQLMVKQVEAE